MGIQTQEGRPINCNYFEKPLCTATCNPEDKNEYGNCTRYFCAETGEPIPPNLNGMDSDCGTFIKQLFTETLKVSKLCKNNALANGCISDTHRGIDAVRKELYPDNNYDPDGMWSDKCLKNDCAVFVLSNGTLIINYDPGLYNLRPVWLVDINGKKGPNKFGYDMFTFMIRGDMNNGITRIAGSNSETEPGGKNFDNMVKEVFGK